MLSFDVLSLFCFIDNTLVDSQPNGNFPLLRLYYWNRRQELGEYTAGFIQRWKVTSQDAHPAELKIVRISFYPIKNDFRDNGGKKPFKLKDYLVIACPLNL